MIGFMMTKNFGRNKPRTAEKARTDPGFFFAYRLTSETCGGPLPVIPRQNIPAPGPQSANRKPRTGFTWLANREPKTARPGCTDPGPSSAIRSARNVNRARVPRQIEANRRAAIRRRRRAQRGTRARVRARVPVQLFRKQLPKK